MKGHPPPHTHTHTHTYTHIHRLAIYIAYLEDCYGNRLPVATGGYHHISGMSGARGREEKKEKKKKKKTTSSSSSSRGWGLPGSVSSDRNTQKQPHWIFFVLPVMKWGARRLWEDASARRCCCFGCRREQDTSVIQRRDGEPALTETPEPPSWEQQVSAGGPGHSHLQAAAAPFTCRVFISIVCLMLCCQGVRKQKLKKRFWCIHVRAEESSWSHTGSSQWAAAHWSCAVYSLFSTINVHLNGGFSFRSELLLRCWSCGCVSPLEHSWIKCILKQQHTYIKLYQRDDSYHFTFICLWNACLCSFWLEWRHFCT